MKKIELAETVDEVMAEELREYKETLTCPSCKVKKKMQFSQSVSTFSAGIVYELATKLVKENAPSAIAHLELMIIIVYTYLLKEKNIQHIH